MFSIRRIVLCFAFAASLAAARHSPAQSAAARAADTLQHGISLSGWFTWGDYSQRHLDTWITPADLRLIHDAGFDNVRIGVDPVFLTRGGLAAPPGSQPQQTKQALAQLDHAVSEALAAHLAVTLTVFPDDNYKHALATDRGVEDLVLLWRVLAQHFAATDPDHLFFELVNEPEVQDPYRWMGIQARLVAAVRQIDPRHTILATAGSYSSLPDLLRLEPVRDPNVIYTFHFYEPYPFTHQGAPWGSSEWVYYKNIPYPAASSGSLERQEQAVPDDLARYQLYLYRAGKWDEQAFAERLAFAAAWARERGVPILCNEFGVFRDTADAASRARWIGDVRAALEQNHIPWAMWDYRGNFGLVTRTDTAIAPDSAVLRALGRNSDVSTVSLRP